MEEGDGQGKWWAWGASVAALAATVGVSYWKYRSFHGAGVLPYAFVEGKLLILLHTKEKGRKVLHYTHRPLFFFSLLFFFSCSLFFRGLRRLAFFDPLYNPCNQTN